MSTLKKRDLQGRSTRVRGGLIGLLVNIPVWLLSITCIFPVVWIVYSSFKTKAEFSQNVLALPKEISFTNYLEAFSTA